MNTGVLFKTNLKTKSFLRVYVIFDKWCFFVLRQFIILIICMIFLLFYDNFNSMLMFLYYNNLIYNINGYILYSRNHFKLVLKFVVQKLYNVSYATTK